MNTKLIGTALLALAIGVAAVFGIQSYLYPNTVTISGIACYLEDERWLNGTGIEWGILEPDASYSYNFTAQNYYEYNVTVTMHVTALPLNWTLTWAGNNTFLEPYEATIGDLTLTIPANVTAGTYTFYTEIRVTKT